jgi:hypothetical protein
LLNRSFLFQRQSHVILQYEQSIKHFILCPSGLFGGARDNNLKIHSAASHCFVDIQSLPETLGPQHFAIIGILGPSISYTSTGQALKSGFRLLALGREGNNHRGYDLAYQCLMEYSNAWKEEKKVEYRNREPLKARKVIKPQEASNRQGRVAGWRRRQPIEVTTENLAGSMDAAAIQGSTETLSEHTDDNPLQGSTAELVPNDLEPTDRNTDTPSISNLNSPQSSSSQSSSSQLSSTQSSSPSSRLDDMRSPPAEQALQGETRSPSPPLNQFLDHSSQQSFGGPQDPAPHDDGPVTPTRPVTPANPPLKLSLLQLGALFGLMKQNQGPAAEGWRSQVRLIHHSDIHLRNVQYGCYYAYFNGRLIEGLELLKGIERPPNKNDKLCVFGCQKKEGRGHRWFSSGVYDSWLLDLIVVHRSAIWSQLDGREGVKCIPSYFKPRVLRRCRYEIFLHLLYNYTLCVMV